MKRSLRIGMLMAALAAASTTAQSSDRVTVKPAQETPGRLLHGLTLDAMDGDFPVIIKMDGIVQPVIGMAHLQSPGRAVISIVSFGSVSVSGYVVSPADRKPGLPVTCTRERELRNSRECIAGDIAAGEKVGVIFPQGLDIITSSEDNHPKPGLPKVSARR